MTTAIDSESSDELYEMNETALAEMGITNWNGRAITKENIAFLPPATEKVYDFVQSTEEKELKGNIDAIKTAKDEASHSLLNRDICSLHIDNDKVLACHESDKKSKKKSFWKKHKKAIIIGAIVAVVVVTAVVVGVAVVGGVALANGGDKDQSKPNPSPPPTGKQAPNESGLPKISKQEIGQLHEAMRHPEIIEQYPGLLDMGYDPAPIKINDDWQLPYNGMGHNEVKEKLAPELNDPTIFPSKPYQPLPPGGQIIPNNCPDFVYRHLYPNLEQVYGPEPLKSQIFVTPGKQRANYLVLGIRE